MRCGFALVLLSTLAAADPKPASPPKPDKAVLAQGQKLSTAGKHKEAIAQYEKYLALDPDNEIANAELGWSAFQLKDYAKAEAATRRAIKNGSDPQYRTDAKARPKGAALYNLALILDAQGKRAEAATALVDSLVARPNRVVREKLQQLDLAKAGAADPLRPAKMEGPLTSAYVQCENCSASPSPAKATLAAPFEAVEVIQKWHMMAVAVKVAGKWYRVDVGVPLPCGSTESQLKGARMVGKTLAIEFTANGTCSSISGGHDNDWRVKSRNTIAVGVGSSGVPTATIPITTSIDAVHELDGREYGTTRAGGTLTWKADGSFELAGTFDSPVSDGTELVAEDLLGRHVLAFP